jgi:adenylate cyclase
MIRLIAILLLIYSCFPGIMPAQEVKRDSIASLLESAKPDTNKVNILLDLGRTLYRSAPKDAIEYSREAIVLSKKLEFMNGLALANKHAGLAHYVSGEYAEAINYFQEARLAFESIADQSGVANILSNMGAIYNNFGEDTRALELYFEAQAAAEKIGDSLRIVTTMINIGTIYVKKPATLDKAIEFYRAALPIAEALKNYDAIGTASVNMGEAYYKKGDYSSALIHYQASMSAFEKSSSGNLPYALTSIGNVYARQGDFESALANQERALSITRSLNAKPDMVSAYLGLADTYKLKGDPAKAIESLRQAQVLAEEISANFELRDAYAGLAQLHATIADYFNAYKYQVLLSEIREVLYLSSNDNLIKQQQLSSDLVKKQGELELQNLAMQKQRIVKNAILAGLILIILIAFIIFRNYLNKVKVNRLLDKQKVQIENLLLNILPAEVARELQDHGLATPRDYHSVSVLFTDFKDFTRIAEGLPPTELVAELNEYFQAFDTIVEKNNLEKIKTIGDAYMCAGGIPTENFTHPENIVRAGLEMQEYMRLKNAERAVKDLVPWGLRVGVHTGPVVAGVVGRKKYAYDIWGNTVNIASRMESNGAVGKVNISATTYELVRDKFECEYRGKISAKNVGEIDMYFIENEMQSKLN